MDVSCNLKNCFWFKCKYFFILGSAGLYIAGSLMMFLYGPVSFGNCDSFPSNGDRLIFCAGFVPRITILIIVVFALLALVFIIVGCIAEKNRTHFKRMELSSMAKYIHRSKKAPNSLDIVNDIDIDIDIDNDEISNNPFIGEPNLEDRPIPQDLIDLCKRILEIASSLNAN